MAKTKLESLKPKEKERYLRQIALPGFGRQAQLGLKNSRVAVIGAGGLGAPVLQYLASAGVGTLGIFDFDRVERSNLQRQVLFTEYDLGQPKAITAAKKLQALNSHLQTIPHQQKIKADNAESLLKDYDVVVDGSDNFLTRYIVNDSCLLLDIPLVYGSIYQFEGQVAVFNYKHPDGTRGPDYRALFPEMPEEGFIPNCATGGVIGALAGIIGSMQAMEVIKILTGSGQVLSEEMLIFDALTMECSKYKIPFDPNKTTTKKSVIRNRLKALSDIEINDEVLHCDADTSINEIDYDTLQEWQNREVIQLVDVRTEEEHKIDPIGGQLIPLSKLKDQQHLISTTKKTVIYCETGIRSKKAIDRLQKTGDYQNLYNLKGGIAVIRN